MIAWRNMEGSGGGVAGRRTKLRRRSCRACRGQGWTVVHLPSTPWVIETVRSDMCGTDLIGSQSDLVFTGLESRTEVGRSAMRQHGERRSSTAAKLLEHAGRAVQPPRNFDGIPAGGIVDDDSRRNRQRPLRVFMPCAGDAGRHAAASEAAIK